MSTKRKALAVAARVGATYDDRFSYADGRGDWELNFDLPAGKKLNANDLHGAIGRGETKAEAWQDAIDQMLLGVSDCDCADCLQEQARIVEMEMKK